MPTGKRDLIRILSEKTGLVQKQTAQVVDAFIETVGEKLAEGDRATILFR